MIFGRIIEQVITKCCISIYLEHFGKTGGNSWKTWFLWNFHVSCYFFNWVFHKVSVVKEKNLSMWDDIL